MGSQYREIKNQYTMKKYNGSTTASNGNLKTGLNARLDLGTEVFRAAAVKSINTISVSITEAAVTSIVLDLWYGENTPQNRANALRLINVYQTIPGGVGDLTPALVREAYDKYRAGYTAWDTPPAATAQPSSADDIRAAARAELLKELAAAGLLKTEEERPTLNQRLAAKNRR